MSFDIETDPKSDYLLAISLYSSDVDEVLIVDPEDRPVPPRARSFVTEKAVLEAFAARVREINPDVLTGWNVIDFDLAVLNRISDRVGVPLNIGRQAGRTTIREAQGYFGSGQANVPGRLVLDGIDLIRGAFIRFEEYSLEAVSRQVLGEGKTIIAGKDDRAKEIFNTYEHDLEGFATYARTDARLAFEVLAELDLISLAVARSKLTGMPMDRVAASIASFDFVYLSALRKRKICAPTVGSGDLREIRAHAGGQVLEPEVGIHPNAWVLDFKSLYPSIVQSFNIDPFSFTGKASDKSDIVLLNGASFDRKPGILPSILDELFEKREEAKKSNDQIASQAIKILMNSFYGVLATPACRFYNSTIGNSITTMGRHFLTWAQSWFEERNHRVLYGDTDSVFVASGIDDPALAHARGLEITKEFNDSLKAYIRSTWNVDSKLEMEFEKLYVKLFLLPLRTGSGGARKRYAGLLFDETREVEFVGMEVVRRDWTDLAKDVQRELYRRVFASEPVDAYLQDVVSSVRNGDCDDKLVYRKGLSRPLNEYKDPAPPHVRAARKSQQESRVIHYVMTVDGPEPVDNVTHDLDLEHYVEKQIKHKPMASTFDTVL